VPDGLLRFARYAFPPNERGLCGPDRASELAEAIELGVGDPDVRAIAQGFSGAWPYLVLLGSELSRGDALDQAVVDAYWLGEPSGRSVALSTLGDSLRERFGGRTGWTGLRDSVELGGWPTHAYHVFMVYPWIGLIRSGLMDPGLEVIDRCRIRWGRVVEITGDRALVSSDQLAWNGHSIQAGPERIEAVSVLRNDGDIEVGSMVSLHWDWVCEPITARQVHWLRKSQEHHLRLANAAGATARLA
jgi:hypothetical protein